MGDFNLRKWREFILSEDESSKEKRVVDIEDITLDMLKELFPTRYQNVHFIRPQTGEPYYRDKVQLPLGAGSYYDIGDSLALEQWRNQVKKSGFKQVTIDPSRAWNNFPARLVYSPEQLDRETRIGQGIAKYYSDKKPGEFQGD
jgi:hypothetical protein